MKMGHSRLCSFDGRLIYGTKEARVGIETLKEAKHYLNNERITVDKVILWPQTARAKRMAQGFDYILLTKNGIKRQNVQEGILA